MPVLLADDEAGGVQVISLGGLELLEPSRYPAFTLLGQAWGSVRLAWRALNTTRPEVRCLAWALTLDRLPANTCEAQCCLTGLSAPAVRKLASRLR